MRRPPAWRSPSTWLGRSPVSEAGSDAKCFPCRKALFCRAGARPGSSCSLREALSYPAGLEQSLGLRIERSPPTRLRMRPECAARRVDPRRRREAAAPYPHDGQRVGDPHAPARWLLPPAGPASPPSARSLRTCTNCFATPARRLPRFVPPHFGRGAFNPPGGCQRPCLRRLRVTERASHSGVSLARFHANSEGPHRGTSLLGRSLRSLGASRAGASKRREAAHPPGKKKPHAVKGRRPAAHSPRGKGTLHEVERRARARTRVARRNRHAVEHILGIAD